MAVFSRFAPPHPPLTPSSPLHQHASAPSFLPPPLLPPIPVLSSPCSANQHRLHLFSTASCTSYTSWLYCTVLAGLPLLSPTALPPTANSPLQCAPQRHISATQWPNSAPLYSEFMLNLYSEFRGYNGTLHYKQNDPFRPEP